MKLVVYLICLIAAIPAFAQTNKLNNKLLQTWSYQNGTVANNYYQYKQPSSSRYDSASPMPNALRVAPQLRNKAGNNGRGFDIYVLSDGMKCLVPDSSFTSNMPVAGKNPSFQPVAEAYKRNGYKKR